MTPEQSHEKQHAFFQFPHFAVIGASDHPEKWGGLIVHLFKERAKDIIPVNPDRETVEGVPCLKSVSDLPDPEQTPIVVVTKPAHTLQILSDAKQLKIPMIWLQPGSYDDTVYSAMQENNMVDRTLFAGSPTSHSSPFPPSTSPSIPTSDSISSSNSNLGSDSASDDPGPDSEPTTPTDDSDGPHTHNNQEHHDTGLKQILQHLLPGHHKHDPKGSIEAKGPCGAVSVLERAGTTIMKDVDVAKDFTKSKLSRNTEVTH